MTDIVLRDMDDSESGAFLAVEVDRFAGRLVQLGGWDPAESQAHAERSVQRFFPDARPGPGQHLYVAVAAATGNVVGRLWLDDGGGEHGRATISWIEILPDFRGRGFGRQLLALAEQQCRCWGRTQVTLNVFARNDAARSLYASAGYRELAVSMAKEL